MEAFIDHIRCPFFVSLLGRAETWYTDATLKVVREPFAQLFGSQAFVKSGSDVKQVPLAFALMTDRTKKDYKKVSKHTFT